MSTRSNIAIVNADGSVDSVYCHWDGYPEGVGACLVLAHNSEDEARQIIKLGDMSVLRNYLLPNPAKPHTFDNPQEDVTIFYGRDRGEEGIEAKHWKDWDDWTDNAYEASWAEYCYWWEDGKWHCWATGTEKCTDLYAMVEEDEEDTVSVDISLANVSSKDLKDIEEYLIFKDVKYEIL